MSAISVFFYLGIFTSNILKTVNWHQIIDCFENINFSWFIFVKTSKENCSVLTATVNMDASLDFPLCRHTVNIDIENGENGDRWKTNIL